VAHSGLVGFRTLSIVRYSEEHDVSETDPFSETSCSFGYWTLDKSKETVMSTIFSF
jgi:hypothetical protein